MRIAPAITLTEEQGERAQSCARKGRSATRTKAKTLVGAGAGDRTED